MKSSSLLKIVFAFVLLVAYVEATKLCNCLKLKDLLGLGESKKSLIHTKSGWLQGKFVEKNGKSFYSFKGIPYAEPPVGKLRFQAPVCKKPWLGIRPAVKHGSYCANNFGYFGVTSIKGGSEDCLFLNVYSPKLGHLQKMPVMFWIHGGGMMSGNGDDLLYGPDHLVSKGVVVVTINYRLGAFGFLSTGDENAPGNQGIKDVVMALQWVKDNIKHFGGNPNKVTVFGQCAGAAITNVLLLSDSSKGLFNQGIIMSGSTLMECHYQSDPKSQAENLGHRFHLTFNNTKDLVQKLQGLCSDDFLKVETPLLDMGDPWGLRSFEFALTSEPSCSKNPILSENPIDRILSGKYQKMPLMIGGGNLQGIFIADSVQKKLSYYNDNPDFLIPLSFGLNDDHCPKERREKAIHKLQELYFGGNSKGCLNDWINVFSDGIFNLPQNRAAKLFAKNCPHPIFNYQFSFDGALNFFQKNLSVNQFEGASHGDELFYLFEPGFDGFKADEKSSLVREKMTTLWTNFAKFGNPTPEVCSMFDEIWKPFTIENEFFYEIGADASLSNRKNLPRMKALSDLQVEFTGHY